MGAQAWLFMGYDSLLMIIIILIMIVISYLASTLHTNLLDSLRQLASEVLVFMALLCVHVRWEVIIRQKTVPETVHIWRVLVKVHHHIAMRTSSSKGRIGSTNEGRVLREDLLREMSDLGRITGIFE